MVEGGGSKLFRFVKEWINKRPELSHKILDVTTVSIEFLAQQVVAGKAQIPLKYLNLGVEN